MHNEREVAKIVRFFVFLQNKTLLFEMIIKWAGGLATLL